MKARSAQIFALVLLVVLPALYFLYPKNEFAVRDDVLLRQMSFLINADICIRDFEYKNNRIPKDMDELIGSCPRLLSMKKSFENDTRMVIYLNETLNQTRIRIYNFRPRVDLELGSSGNIKKISSFDVK